jgi:hypothetical protein
LTAPRVFGAAVGRLRPVGDRGKRWEVCYGFGKDNMLRNASALTLVCMLAFAGCAAVLDDCREPTPPGQAPLSMLVVQRERLFARYTILNVVQDAVLIEACGPKTVTTVEEQRPLGWSPYACTFCPAMYDRTPKRLAPGDSLVEFLAVQAPGTYRVQVRYWARGHWWPLRKTIILGDQVVGSSTVPNGALHARVAGVGRR